MVQNTWQRIRLFLLFIYNNKIGENGAKYLAENETIHTLNLHYNKIGDNGAKYLAGNKTVHTLDLRENNIGENDAKYFLKSSIPNLIMEGKYIGVVKISRQNYVKYIQDIQKIASRYIIKDITCVVMKYVKND